MHQLFRRSFETRGFLDNVYMERSDDDTAITVHRGLKENQDRVSEAISSKVALTWRVDLVFISRGIYVALKYKQT